jgi:hypothetical protein
VEEVAPARGKLIHAKEKGHVQEAREPYGAQGALLGRVLPLVPEPVGHRVHDEAGAAAGGGVVARVVPGQQPRLPIGTGQAHFYYSCIIMVVVVFGSRPHTTPHHHEYIQGRAARLL